MRTLDFLPGPLELPFEKGIVNDVVVDDGEDEAKVIGGNVVPKSRRVETVGENDSMHAPEYTLTQDLNFVTVEAHNLLDNGTFAEVEMQTGHEWS